MSPFVRMIPIILLAFLGGVFVASLATPPVSVVWVLFLFSFVFGAVALFEKTARMAIVFLVCVGVTLGVFRYLVWYDVPLDPILVSQVGTTVTLTGEVIDEPDVREKNTHLTVALIGIQTGSSTDAVSGTLILFAERYPEYGYGDRLSLKGKLELPQSFTEPDGRVFDYPAYLRSKDIRYQMAFAKIELMGKNESFSLKGFLFSVKHRFQSAISDALPEPHGSLLSGLLLGGKQSLGAEWLGYFKTAGIIHIVVLSGYNMSIVAQWLMVGFRFLGFYGSLSVGALGIVLFALMTGGGATVVRAAILALLVLLARLTGRAFEMGRALLFAGAAMVFVNPSILLFDPSFQLSFLASLGLVYMSPVIAVHLSLWKNLPMLREVFVSTLATQITVLPLLLYQTGMLSLISLPANLLVLPFIPISMLLGFVGGISTLLAPSVGVLVMFPAYTILSYILEVAKHAALIPFAAVSLRLSPVAVAVLYSALIFWIRSEYRKRAIPMDALETTLSPFRSLEEPSLNSTYGKKETQ